eukprot:CAMPEP_0119549668 /NCGR_PEP_ID=MMETSP1352-20130426/3321_1 /TAXON_ID=265584 /ORGANISM="Stauroneis constricta, Strain CCMP1120" /LENGTH=124 /DNA_ID=CAMNT_0007595271 /DNA_START=85 /DNA_END=459 /DNA_ORIENTATION=-
MNGSSNTTSVSMTFNISMITDPPASSSYASPPSTPRRTSAASRRSTLTSVPEDSEFLNLSPSPSYDGGFMSGSMSAPTSPVSGEECGNLVKKLRRMKRRLLLEQVNKPMSSILMPSTSAHSTEQ